MSKLRFWKLENDQIYAKPEGLYGKWCQRLRRAVSDAFELPLEHHRRNSFVSRLRRHVELSYLVLHFFCPFLTRQRDGVKNIKIDFALELKLSS